MAQHGISKQGDHDRELAAMRRKVHALERANQIFSADTNTAMTVARLQADAGAHVSLVACTYDPIIASATVNCTLDRLAFGAILVPEPAVVQSIFAGIVAGTTLGANGQFNGLALYRYEKDDTEGERLVLLGRTASQAARWESSIANGGNLAAMTAYNSAGSTYGLAGDVTDLTIDAGLYYLAMGYSCTFATTAQYRYATAGPAAMSNMSYDQDSYSPVGRFAAYNMTAGTVPPDRILAASLAKASGVPFMSLHS